MEALQPTSIETQLPTILDLPNELLCQIIGFLPAASIFALVQTCHRFHGICLDESIWRLKVQGHIPYQLPLHIPERRLQTVHKGIESGNIETWLDLYKGFLHLWFILDKGLWMSDRGPGGDLVIALFDLETLQICGYRLTAQDLNYMSRQVSFWKRTPDVVIITFQPLLTRQRQVFRISHPGPVFNRTASEVEENTRTGLYSVPNRFLPPEVRSPDDEDRLILARNLQPAGIDPRTEVWPPQVLPSTGRVRNPRNLATAFDDDGNTPYTSVGYRPTVMGERSTTAFRLIPGVVVPQFASDPLSRILPYRRSILNNLDVRTFGAVSIPEPTETNPFSGVWIGDYDGHGGEFIALLPLDLSNPNAIPAAATEIMSGCQWFDRFLDIRDQVQRGNLTSTQGKYRGGLYGVKLTGDRNVPRGEYSFIVPWLDLILRESQEKPFKKSLVVGAVGHIAGDGFHQDEYIPAEMIILSHDRIAFYWETLGHISFFERANLKALQRKDPPIHVWPDRYHS